jgi:hypothetical protein
MRNEYDWRYWTTPVFLILLLFASIVAEAVCERVPTVLCAAALVIGALAAFGVPSVARATAAINEVGSRQYDKIVNLRCTHFIGNYWYAWASVFYNRAHAIEPKLWAVTMRSDITRDEWDQMPPARRRYCGMCGDPSINYYELVFKLGPLKHIAADRDMCLYLSAAPKVLQPR